MPLLERALMGQSTRVSPFVWTFSRREPVKIVDEARFDPRGRWIGDYGPHGPEEVEIVERGDLLVATKITGDPNVPAGEVTFEVRLGWRRGDGRGRIAGVGFTDPSWVAGRFEFVDRDRFVFHWAGLGSVLFVRKGPSGCP